MLQRWASACTCSNDPAIHHMLSPTDDLPAQAHSQAPTRHWQSQKNVGDSSAEIEGTLSSHSSSSTRDSPPGSMPGNIVPPGHGSEKFDGLPTTHPPGSSYGRDLLPGTQLPDNGAQDMPVEHDSQSRLHSGRPRLLSAPTPVTQALVPLTAAPDHTWQQSNAGAYWTDGDVYTSKAVADAPFDRLHADLPLPAMGAGSPLYVQLWHQLAYTLALQVVMFESQAQLWSAANAALLHNDLLLQHSHSQAPPAEQRLPSPLPFVQLRSLLRLLAGVGGEGQESNMDVQTQRPMARVSLEAASTSSAMPGSPFAATPGLRTGSFLAASRASGSGNSQGKGGDSRRGLQAHLSMHTSSVASLAHVRLSQDSTSGPGMTQMLSTSHDLNNGALNSSSRVGSRPGSYEGGSGSFASMLLGRHSKVVPSAEPSLPPPPLAWPSLSVTPHPNKQGPASASGLLSSPASPRLHSPASSNGRLLSQSMQLKQRQAEMGPEVSDAGGPSPPGSSQGVASPRSGRLLSLPTPAAHSAASQPASGIQALLPDPAYRAPSQLILKSHGNLPSESGCPLQSPSLMPNSRASGRLLLRPPRPPSASAAASPRPRSATSVHAGQSRLTPKSQPYLTPELSASMPMLPPASGAMDASCNSPRSSPALDCKSAEDEQQPQSDQ
jgi:hypothetical protein